MSRSQSWIKKTLNLPNTSFTPRPPATLSERASLLKRCSDELYTWQRNRTDRPPFILHDGPPYANGDLHIGHALNKILKDITCRFHLSQGKQITFVPGWDCHGLPIELKALERQAERANNGRGSNEETSSMQDGRGAQTENAITRALSIRKLARNLASTTIEKQKKQFRQWGIMADWDNSWKTMDKEFEIKQLKVFRKMVGNGLIYRRFKPVYWSPSTRTALAEAELEYRDDHESTAAFVKYPIAAARSLRQRFDDIGQVSCVIWTTMPWTLPANRAIGFNPKIDYAVLGSQRHGPLLVARSRATELAEQFAEELPELLTLKGSDLVGATYSDSVWTNHRAERPLLPADHVTEDSGSGLAHLAPGHGPEDYRVCLKHGIDPVAPVDERGAFDSSACLRQPELLLGQEVMGKGNETVLTHVAARGMLMARHKYIHKYPYDWRSKKPVILRATAQWFANVGALQEKALQALDQPELSFTPRSCENRLINFVKNRSEWCISRQRAWGVPIPALFHKDMDNQMMTEESLNHIISLIRVRGIDAWWSDPEDEPAWTPPQYRNADGTSSYRRGTDTMDVWFDSGTSWTQTTDQNGNPQPADVYLEGGDQHRGWFQSSLLTYTANQTLTVKGRDTRTPFRSLVTHGFVLDQNGRKMSKSEGNVIAPSDIIDGSLLPPLKKKVNGKVTEFQDTMGPDALRLWVASCDFTKDVTLSIDKLKVINNTLAKFRVTFKQLLGIMGDSVLPDYELQVNIPINHRIALWQLQNMRTAVMQYYGAHDYHKVVDEITRYVNVDLSAFYFETIKDCAYCGTHASQVLVRTTLHIILSSLMQVMAPILPLLVQEVYDHVPTNSRHCTPDPFRVTQSSTIIEEYHLGGDIFAHLNEDVPRLMTLSESVKKLQELARTDKKMGSSLECNVVLEPILATNTPATGLLERYRHDLADVLVVSHVAIGTDITVPAMWHYEKEVDIFNERVKICLYSPQKAKCIRCWRYLAPRDKAPTEALCNRCEEIVDTIAANERQ